jgi:hypothetical protein
MDRGVGADHVVVGEQMGVAELLDPVGVGAHSADIATEFGLGEDHADAHTANLSAPRKAAGRETRPINTGSTAT